MWEGEDEKKVLCDRLASLENELQRRDELIDSLNTEKSKILEDLAETRRLNSTLEQRVEELENAEYESSGLTRQLQCSLQEAKLVKEKEAEFYHSSLEQLKTKLKTVNTKYELALEKHDSLSDEILIKLNKIEDLKSENDKIAMESSSRIANLNQVLLHLKQTCSQLECRNEELLQQEEMLLSENETLEKKCQTLATQCSSCAQRQESVKQNDCTDTAHMRKSFSSPTAIPLRSLPLQNEAIHLQSENVKLNQKYECLLVNFQMMSDKYGQIKQHKKESEDRLLELQAQCDKLCKEKEEILSMSQVTPNNDDSFGTDHSAQHNFNEEVSLLSDELKDVQCKYDELQSQYNDLVPKLKNMQCTVLAIQDRICSLKLDEKEKLGFTTQDEIQESMEEVSLEKNKANDGSSASIKDGSCVCMKGVQVYTEKETNIEKERELLQKANEQMSSQLVLHHDQKVALENTIDKLKLQIEALSRQFLKSNQTSANATEEIASLHSQLHTLSERNEKLLEEKQALLSIKESSDVQIGKLMQSISACHKESSQDKDTICKLRSELMVTQDDLDNKTRKLNVNIKELESIKIHLKQALDDKDTLLGDIAEMHSKVDNLETSNYELHVRCTEITNVRNSTQLSYHQAKEKVDELLIKLAAADNVLLQKESELNDVKITADTLSLENTKLILQIDQLSDSLQKSNKENETLREKMSDCQYKVNILAKEMSDLENIHEHCESTCIRLEDECATAHQALRQLEEKAEKLKKEKESCLLEQTQLEKSNDSLNCIIDDLQNKMQIELSRYDDLKTDMEKKDRKIQALKEKVEFESTQNCDLEQEYKQIQNELTQKEILLQEKMGVAEGRYNHLQDNHDELIATHNSTLSQMTSLQLKVGELQQVADDATAQKEEINGKMEVLRDEKGYCQKTAEMLRSQLKEMKKELRYQERKLKDQEKFMERNMFEYSSTVKEFKSLRSGALQILSDPSPVSSCDNSNPTTRRRHSSENSSEL